MSRPEFGDDERQLRSRDGATETGPLDWLGAVVYYGLGQVLFFGLLGLWLAFLAPVHRDAIVGATVVGMISVSLVIGVGRLGRLPVGRPWPALGDVTIGTVGSYRAYLTRITLLDATFMWVAYGSLALSLLSPSIPRLPVAAAIGATTTAAYPWLSAESRGFRIGRAVFQLGGVLVVVAVVDLGAVVATGFYQFPAVLGLALLLVVLDGLPLVTRSTKG